MSRHRSWLPCACAFALWACASETPPAEAPIVDVDGSCADVYGGQVCTWARMQEGNIVEIGATIPMTSIENAPMDVPMAWPPPTLAALEMPEAAQMAGGFRHMTMGWEPVGHPPAAYLVPHFDFHFYSIPNADRMAIDCSDVSKPTALPAAYTMPDETLPPEVAEMIGISTLIGVCVPEMGMHAMPTAEVEGSDIFRGTMVVGYYHGQTIFTEPMITQAMLRERKSFDLTVPSVAGASGKRPTAFHAEYMPDTDSYRFVFTGM